MAKTKRDFDSQILMLKSKPRLFFVKAAPQKLCFNDVGSLKFKTFIDITPQAPKKAKNVQKGKQVITEKPIYPKVSHLKILEKHICDLTQQLENALIVKVGL